jgi:hypothetical protein
MEYWVIGYQTEDQKHPGEQIPGKWPLKTNLDTKVMEIPNLRHRITDPVTGEVINLAENNAYCAFSVSFLFCVKSYIYFVLACSSAMRFFILATGFFFREMEQEVI